MSFTWDHGLVERVYLFGNGLSLAFDHDHYALTSITRRVQERLSEVRLSTGQSLLERLEEIRSSLAPDTGRVRSFEDIAGPVDRLARTISESGPLASFADTDEQRRMLKDLSLKVVGLYRRIVGVVLSCVMDHGGENALWASVDSIAQYLGREAERQGHLDVFVLNYDALLDSGLIQAQDASKAFQLMDEFSGRRGLRVPVHCASGVVRQIPSLRWREDSWMAGKPRLRLHHLHGAGTWMRREGFVYKAGTLDSLRDCRLFRAWAEGTESEVEPAVLLGDQKQRWVNLWPFIETYQQLAASVSSADEIILAGYSFGDLPLNRMIASSRRPDSRVVVINPSRNIGDKARAAFDLWRREDRARVIGCGPGTSRWASSSVRCCPGCVRTAGLTV